MLGLQAFFIPRAQQFHKAAPIFLLDNCQHDHLPMHPFSHTADFGSHV
jgi:hypothetical protein